jgi:uncharacterized protein (DUF1330 family)
MPLLELCMPAFFIVTITVKDADKYQTYSQSVGETLKPFGGKGVLRGKAQGALVGTLDHQMAGIIEFPDLESIDAWYNSEAYQALIPLRTEAADVTIIKYAVPN